MAVYKYLGPERLDVLWDARIHSTQPAALNDPFELRRHFESLVKLRVIDGHPGVGRDNAAKRA